MGYHMTCAAHIQGVGARLVFHHQETLTFVPYFLRSERHFGKDFPHFLLPLVLAGRKGFLVEKSPECREGELGHEERSLYVDVVEEVRKVMRNSLNGVCGDSNSKMGRQNVVNIEVISQCLYLMSWKVRP